MLPPWLPLTQQNPKRAWYGSVSHDLSLCILTLYILVLWSVFVW